MDWSRQVQVQQALCHWAHDEIGAASFLCPLIIVLIRYLGCFIFGTCGSDMLQLWDGMMQNWLYLKNLVFGTKIAGVLVYNRDRKGCYAAKYLSCG